MEIISVAGGDYLAKEATFEDFFTTPEKVDQLLYTRTEKGCPCYRCVGKRKFRYDPSQEKIKKWLKEDTLCLEIDKGENLIWFNINIVHVGE